MYLIMTEQQLQNETLISHTSDRTPPQKTKKNSEKASDSNLESS